MRPIEKGDWPQVNGANVNFLEYGDARPYLIERIQDFCSYCENQITNPAIEHEQPKGISPAIENNWYNFLLACVSCNSRKGHGWINVDDYYWPDIHNTFLLFDYFPGGVVTVKSNLDAGIDRNRAEATLKLTGLQLYGSLTTDADRRWIKRSQAWGKAEYCLLFYENYGLQVDFIQCILDTATSTGFLSVWMTVFTNHPAIQTILIKVYAGTFEHCRTTNIQRL